MADPTPPSPQPATPTKPPLGEPVVEGSPLELLRQNASTMVAILVAVVALAVLLTWRSGQSQQRELEAWGKLAELRKQMPTIVDGFPEAAEKYEGTDAEPFIRMGWAARLYETGERAKVERALELMKQVEAQHRNHPLFGAGLSEQVKKVEAELASPRCHLVTVQTPAQVEKDGPAAPGTQTPAAPPGRSN